MFGGLFTIDASTGVATDVNPSQGSTNIQCLAFSPDGTLYGAQNGLFTIDIATGVPTYVGGSLSDVRGMDFNTGPAFVLRIGNVEPGARICWFTETNKTYQLQQRIGLGQTNFWVDVGPQYTGTGGEICVTNATDDMRQFYRARTVSL